MTKIRKKQDDLNDFQRNLRNLRISWQGVVSVWREERSFQQYSLLNLVSWILLALLHVDLHFCALVVYAGLQILTAELLNTGIESVVDQHSHEHSDLGKLAKDAGSAAVALALLGFLIVWGFVLFQHFH